MYILKRFRILIVLCSMIAAFTMLVAMLIPFFGSPLTFLGGIVFAPLTYFVRNPSFFIQTS